jgi:hypothetical protein
MAMIGFCYLALARDGALAQVSSRERLAVNLRSFGLIAELVSTVGGYIICNIFWPNFYCEPVEMGKNVWLGAQGISIAVYVVGVAFAFIGIRHGVQRVLSR